MNLSPRAWCGWRILLICVALTGARTSQAIAPDATRAATALRAILGTLTRQLSHNPYQRALHLESIETDSHLKGDIHARVDYPFSTVSRALSSAEHWCDVLILHINTKYCQAANDSLLAVSIGSKEAQPLADAHGLEFDYRVVAATPGYLEIQLSAEQGPLSTSHYRIQLQAVAIGANQTFLHLSYGYAYGLTGRLAMQTYLATLGRNKVGFTTTNPPGHARKFIGGVRGLVERNVMRYFLAIDAYLGAVHTAPELRLEQRLQAWFSATEQYPRQLHEVERSAYLDMKRSEYQRQQAGH